jgi:hypothetical protein
MSLVNAHPTKLSVAATKVLKLAFGTVAVPLQMPLKNNPETPNKNKMF